MRNKGLFSKASEWIAVFGAARAAAAATQSNRMPAARDLATLGIEPAQFRSIGR